MLMMQDRSTLMVQIGDWLLSAIPYLAILSVIVGFVGCAISSKWRESVVDTLFAVLGWIVIALAILAISFIVGGVWIIDKLLGYKTIPLLSSGGLAPWILGEESGQEQVQGYC